MFEEENFADFWTHIEDLRLTLLRVFSVIIVAFVLTLNFQEEMLGFIKASIPRNEQTTGLIKEGFKRERITNRSSQSQSFKMPKEADSFSLFSSTSIQKNAENVYQIKPNEFIEYDRLIPETQLVILGPLEGVLTTVKLCFWVALACSSPFWMACLMQFIYPGIKRIEKIWLSRFLGFSLVFIVLAVLLACAVTIPLANRYFSLFNSTIAENLWSLEHYVDYTIVFIAGHVIAFELCLILLLMVHLRIISSDWLVSQRRLMVVVAFVLGAILTPPDIFTQIALALPLIGIYEIAILYAKIRAYQILPTGSRSC